MRTHKLSIGSWGLFLVACSVCWAWPASAQTAPAAAQERGSVTAAPEDEGGTADEELAKDSSTEINVRNADLAAIVRIFSRKTKRNYILDDRVKGKVSIYLPGRVSAEESLRILDSVLAYKGFAAVPVSENLWKILPAKEARQATIPTQTEGPAGTPSSAIVTRLLPLKYVAADDLKQILAQLVSADGMVNSYTPTNSIIVIDAEDNIERLVRLVATLDVPSTDREMTIIPVVNADATDIAAKLSEVLGLGGASGKGAAGDTAMDLLKPGQAANRAAAAGGVPAASQQSLVAAAAGGPAGSPVATRQPKIIPDERTNSIVVVADEDTTAQVRALVSKLDSKIDLSGMRYYVYRCKHASAEDLVDVLSGLVGGGSSGERRSSSSGGSSFGEGDRLGSSSSFGRNRSSNLSKSQDRLRSQQRTPGQSRSDGKSGRGSSGVNLSEELSITADPATNSLIIFATKSDYQKVLALLDDLDIRRRQVLVEAMLLEVGLDDSEKMSTSFLVSGGGADGGVLAQNNAQNITQLLSNPSAIQDFSIAAASAGTITIGGGDSAITLPSQSLLLNAARSNSNVNILSAPTILTTDNEQAEIVVGQNVPFISSTATDGENLNNTFNQIDRQDVGITLRLTPQISAGEAVTLKIFTEVSSVVSTDPDLGPTTAIRTSETSVITRDNQMVVIGGLMADGINEADSGVPYLKDVPVLGHLFRSTVEKHQRTNLLILITPRIVKDQFDARDLTIENRDRMEQEVQRRGVEPPRTEVLHDPAIDRVIDSGSWDGPAPSTITAPKSATTRSSERKSEQRVAEDGTIDITVEPAEPSDATASSSSSGVPLKAHARESFIVAKLGGNYTSIAGLPFTPTAKEALIGIILPAESNVASRAFFQVGEPCAYRLSGTEVPLAPVGVFTSREEAQQMFPDTGLAWYTLSPYEILNLGQGPWIRRGQ